MTVKELIETLKTCDEKSEVKVEHWNSTVSPIEEVIDYSKELSEELNFKAMTVKELIDKLQQFDEDKLVLVEDTEYKEFQAIDVEPVDDIFIIITTTIK